MGRLLHWVSSRWPGLAGLFSIAALLAASAGAAAGEREVLVEGLENPESVVVGHDGRLYVTVIGRSGADGDGTIAVIEDGQAKTFATGLDDPKGIAAHGADLFVADKTRVWKIDASGQVSVLAAADAFPVKPKFLNDIAAGPDGAVYVSDCGNFVADGAVFRIDPTGAVTLVVSQKTAPALKAANGLLIDDAEHLLVADFTAGKLYRVALADGALAELAEGLGGADGLARDAQGRVYTSDWKGGKVYVIESAGAAPRLFLDGFQAAADIVFDAPNNRLLVPDMKAGTISAVNVAD